MFNEPCMQSEEVWQISMQPFFDRLEEPMRARSQMVECQKATEAPMAGKLCTDWEKDAARSANQGLFTVTLVIVFLSKIFFS